MPEFVIPRDRNTIERGVEPPFEPWEADSTALRHVLISVLADGYRFERDADVIAGIILRSRWLAATKHFAQFSWFAPRLAAIPEAPEAYWNPRSQAPPFREWDSDARALVSPIWAARRGVAEPEIGDVVARVFDSRWYAAVIAAARTAAV